MIIFFCSLSLSIEIQYRNCRNKRPRRLIFRRNKNFQKPSVLCTPPFEKSPIKSHRFCVLPSLKNHPSKAIGFVYSPLWKIIHQKPSVLCTPPFEKSLFLVGAYFGVGVYFGEYGMLMCRSVPFNVVFCSMAVQHGRYSMRTLLQWHQRIGGSLQFACSPAGNPPIRLQDSGRRKSIFMFLQRRRVISRPDRATKTVLFPENQIFWFFFGTNPKSQQRRIWFLWPSTYKYHEAPTSNTYTVLVLTQFFWTIRVLCCLRRSTASPSPFPTSWTVVWTARWMWTWTGPWKVLDSTSATTSTSWLALVGSRLTKPPESVRRCLGIFFFIITSNSFNKHQRETKYWRDCIVPRCSFTFWTHPEIIPVGQFFRRGIKSINQSSVDFHYKPFGWLIDWLTISALWLDWFIGLVPHDLFLRGRG